MKRKLSSTIQTKMRGVSPVWIVPFVALIIAVWLAVQAQLEKGETITITYPSAMDIMPGTTLVKLKDVNVGKVTDLRLSDDLSSVEVKVELDRNVLSHLSSNTRFWVVTPKISASGVSNLGTLINGVYIQMDPGEKGEWQTEFVGLAEQPLVKSDQSGKAFILQSDALGSLDVGSAVYYRQIRVGEITGYKLADNRQHVDINFFIKAPFDSLVEEDSRFWNVSGFGVSVSADGIKAQMASLASLMSGGITFENLGGLSSSKEAEEGHRFYLYSDKESVISGQFSHRYFYLAKFTQSVQGLAVGAPVEFKGVKVGEVVDIKLVSADNVDNALHVYLAIEPERFDPKYKHTREQSDQQIEHMVRQGLRAQMKTGSLLTGSKFIDLAYIDDASDGFQLAVREKYSEIPTADDSFAEITHEVAEIITKVNSIPFDKIGADISGTLASLNKLMSAFESGDTADKLGSVIDSADEALKQLSITMEDLGGMVAPDSELQHELTDMLDALGGAGQSLDRFLDELNRNPNSLIYGTEKDQ